jgi:hypothetical protein
MVVSYTDHHRTTAATIIKSSPPAAAAAYCYLFFIKSASIFTAKQHLHRTRGRSKPLINYYLQPLRDTTKQQHNKNNIIAILFIAAAANHTNRPFTIPPTCKSK